MDDIREVFDHWVRVHDKRPNTQLDDARRRKIKKAVEMYGAEDCKRAIEGCKASAFHMGRNDRRKKYNDIALILRDAAHVEQFLDYYEQREDTIDGWMGQ